jgi:hypothetical protein
LSRSYGDMVFQIMPIRLDDANSIVVKTLKPVLWSYRGGVPLSLKKGPWRKNNLSIPIV